MDEKERVLTVPYIVHESAMARSERHIRRLLWTVLCVVVLLAVTNLAWLYVWSQYDYGTEERTYTVDLDADDGGDANYIGEDGDIYNGTD